MHTTILSRRGREIKAKAELKRRLEEKYMQVSVPLSKDQEERVQKVFDEIRRQLKAIHAPHQSLV